MDLYKLHSNPETLDGFDQQSNVPEILRDLARSKQDLAIEQKIIKHPRFAYEYAEYVLDRRWPEAEKYIMKHPESAHRYANKFFKDGWPEAEQYIMTDPWPAYSYAKKFFKGVGWPEAEQYIMTDPTWAARYAIDVVERRWPEAEDDIIEDEEEWNEYTDTFPEAKR